MYTVLARKWRPQTFEDLVGQQTVTQTLKNALANGRTAHAFLFSGPRGVGKTTCARILAKALNCQSSSAPVVTPCNQCASCEDISASRSMDVLEIDGASNRGIDEVRELRESARYQAIRDRFRIFIIDEVHMLTMEAFNALLKILEEPPAHVYFIFATTELRKVPATIVSRCQPHDFRRIPDQILVQRLSQITNEEKIGISEKSLQMIASASEGGLRDALSTLDQIIAFSGNEVSEKDVQTVLGLVDFDVLLDLGRAIAHGNSAGVIALLEKISEYGIDYKIFYNELLQFYRDLFLIRVSDGSTLRGQESDPKLKQLATEYDEVQLMRICHQLVMMQNTLRLSGNVRFLFEITLVKLSQIKKILPLEDLAEALKKNASVSVALPVSRPVVAPPPNPPAAILASAATPAATPAPAVSVPLVELTDDFLATLISELETQNRRLSATLENAKFVRSGTKISFYVPELNFRMMRPDARDQLDLQNLLRQKLGVEIDVEIHGGEPPAEKEVTRVATPETLVQGDPIVQQFVKTFKGKISKIDLSRR